MDLIRTLAPAWVIGRLRFAIFLLPLLAIAVPFDSHAPTRNRFLAGQLMEGTPYETPYYVVGASAWPTVLVLGGVHGDEPGGWEAAEALVEHPPKFSGRIVVVPRANRLADEEGVRSTPELGDLNRLYPGSETGPPMSRMAQEIVGLVARYEPVALIDLHESWDYFANMPPQAPGEVDTGYLGQTISGDNSWPSLFLAAAVTDRVNEHLSGEERFSFFRFPNGYQEKVLVPPPEGAEAELISGNSSSSLAQTFPGLGAILVEVSQQLPIERRVELQVMVVRALLAEVRSPDLTVFRGRP